MKLNVISFALTTGLVWGILVFTLTWWIMAFEGTGGTNLFVTLYRGYSVSPSGSVIGLLWGFADGFLIGLLFSWLYNRLTIKSAE